MGRNWGSDSVVGVAAEKLEEVVRAATAVLVLCFENASVRGGGLRSGR